MVTTKLKESKKVLKNRKRPIQKLTRPSNWQLKNQNEKRKICKCHKHCREQETRKLESQSQFCLAQTTSLRKLKNFSKNQPS